GGSPGSQGVKDTGDHVILVTLDGARTQEIFGGLDAAILKSTLKEGQTVEKSPAYARFWADTREARRQKLMPFLWQLVATEASIGVFNAIAEHQEGATIVNAGIERMGGTDPAMRIVDDLQGEAKPPWDGIRHDAFTFRLAMHHLAVARPRALYIAFDETDDLA